MTYSQITSSSCPGQILVVEVVIPGIQGSGGNGGSGGTVTSVGISVPTGFSVTGSPITVSGTFAISYAAGYSLPTNADQANWTIAFNERLRWDGGASGLNVVTARASIGISNVGISGSYGDLLNTPILGSASSLNVPATGDASVTEVVRGSDSRLSDSREWAASTISQAEVEGGTSTTRRAFNALRLFQGIAAYITANFSAVGQALSTAANPAAARTTLQLGTAAQAASGDFLPSTFAAGTIAYAATLNLDMAALAGSYCTLNLTGAPTFTTSNRASGRTVTIRLICDATQRTLTFPAGWVFLGTKPSTIAASKTAVLSLTFFGTADSDCVAAYGVQA